MRTLLLSALLPVLAAAPAAAAAPATGAIDALHLVPRPAHLRLDGCRLVVRSVSATGDAGGVALFRERANALGAPGTGSAADVLRITPARAASLPPQGYRLTVGRSGIAIVARDGEGERNAYATLAQLARPAGGGRVAFPCLHVTDAPALSWRVLSDDVSRGPLPTMRYFEERIRTIASFKMNGYSPYMEHVFVDARHPLPSPLDGITGSQLRELDAYGRRFHVALIPEQQTFAHMHETLKFERYAPLAELPHGYLLAPAASGGERYVRDLIADELAAVPHPPFFHIGSDEPSDLGRGASAGLVAASGEGPVYTKHVVDTAAYVLGRSGARPMIWDDALSRHPELFASLPKQLVFVNWHYGTEPSYAPYIARIASGGFDQMVAPGAMNWNEIYPDTDVALGNIERFVREGKAARVLGLFQTVWHDDGETLFEATWVPVIYAAASAWEADDVPRDRFAADFPWAFFGSDDDGYARDLADLARARTLLHGTGPDDSSDYLFWSDAFDPRFARVRGALDLAQLRLAAEDAETHLRLAPPPPLHANAARVIALAARRYDVLGREYQIASEARGYYDDARANAGGAHDNFVYRGLYIAKYLLWEERDAMLQLRPLVRDAWDYEDRASHEASVLARYDRAARIAIDRADAIDAATREDYLRDKFLPTFDEVLHLGPAPSTAPSASPSPR